MTICKIGGKEYKVIITEMSENFNILYSENSGRTMSQGARMTLDPLGTFYGHKIKVKRRQGYENDFDALYTYVSKPRYDGILVEMAHNQTYISYYAYVSSGERNIKKVDEKNNKIYWDELSINIIPMEAQVLPV